MNEAKKGSRRKYGADLKQQILAECHQPDASVASVALSHGINANVVHKWRRQASGVLPALQAPSFVPVSLPPAPSVPMPDIRIELRRGATSVSLTWPLAAAEQCALWMRELLK
jgi:transposase